MKMNAWQLRFTKHWYSVYLYLHLMLVCRKCFCEFWFVSFQWFGSYHIYKIFVAITGWPWSLTHWPSQCRHVMWTCWSVWLKYLHSIHSPDINVKK